MREQFKGRIKGQLLPLIANSLWLLSCRHNRQSFIEALNQVEKTQTNLLLGTMRINKHSEYGKRYGFCHIRDVKEFQERVPITSYESYLPDMEKIFHGSSQVLTSERVRILEPTGGSTNGAKLIPYTQSLRNEFQKGIAPWVWDMFTGRKALLSGKAYWSITPVGNKPRMTPGGIPIGFEDDAEYFGRVEKYLLASLMAVPKEVALIGEIDTFRYVTLLYLLKEKYLSFISVWNPTYLTLLLEPIFQWAPSLIQDLENGTVSPPGSLTPELSARFSDGGLKHRGREVSEILQNKGRKGIGKDLWPCLSLISCWADAGAAAYTEELKEWFPGVAIKPKGLLATEGIVSIPLEGENGSALAITSHFFEFVDITGSVKLAHELELEKSYSVLLTTGGGLYRYRLYDLVQVVGFKGQCPLIRFLGKEDGFSDLFGEKLSETHVRSVVENQAHQLDIQLNFYLVTPEKKGQAAFYVLFLEPEGKLEPETLEMLLEGIELGLRGNYHYNYCRELGQLGKLKGFLIKERGRGSYLDRCQAKGQRLGDIKPLALSKDFGWSEVFQGNFIE